uniref:Uncharacterized protein n=1 Tax=Podoviridae sp. ctYFd1 TaxID=2826560 RepID=A0A8S5R216_9CAUD|nr:MAG TPA: hypothetical protein [Podoviridae sp. ctYFd1]
MTCHKSPYITGLIDIKWLAKQHKFCSSVVTGLYLVTTFSNRIFFLRIDF